MDYTKPQIFKLRDMKTMSTSITAPTGNFICGFALGMYFLICLLID